jgi:hypothetical protein
MLVISGLAFGLFCIAYAYIMFYVSDFPNDTGGLAFSRAIYQSFTGIYLMEIMLAGLFFLAQNESGSQSAIPEGILMCVLIAITIGVQFTMSSSLDPLTYYLPVDANELLQPKTSIFGKISWAKTAIRALNSSGTTDSIDAVSNINDAVIESYDYTMENAYMHSAIRDPEPIVWIAQDDLGIAADEIRRTQASGLNILMSTDGARFDEKMNIEIDSPPPDHVETTEKNSLQTRF